MKAIGVRIREIREKAGLTQEQVAGKSMATRTLQRLEDGDGNPTITTLKEIANNLNTSLTELIGAPIQHPIAPDWAESARILNALATCPPHRRLSALYLLLKDEAYLDQLRALPHGAQFAQVLKKSI